MINSLKKSVELVLAQTGITRDSKIVIGVSGGPDSLALLHVLKDIMSQDCLYVGHLNHRLRAEAYEEASFVASTAEAWNLPFRKAEVDVAKLAQQGGLSVEEAARVARYDFLEKLAEDISAKYIVVAHNADDQVETVFLNLLRGTGLAGLRGMETARTLADNSEIVLVRPFLFTSRKAIEDYCYDQNLRPMIDSSNWDLAYRRNYLRHELLPRIASMNPQFTRHLAQLANLIQADEDFLAQQTDYAWSKILREQGPGWLHLDLLKWKALSLSLQRRTLRYGVRLMNSTAKDISFRTIDQAQKAAFEGQTGTEVTLPSGLSLRVAYDLLIMKVNTISLTIDQPQMLSDEIEQLAIPGSLGLAAEWSITSEISTQSLSMIRQNRDPWCAYVDVGDGAELQVRSRFAGERFQPLAMGGRSRSLQDLMVDLKLPAQLRSRWPIVEIDTHPVWLVGYQLDERAKVTKYSKRVVKLTCRKN